MPFDRSRYPADWEAIRDRIRKRAGGKSVTLENTDIGSFTKSLGNIANGRKASASKEGR